MINWKRVCLDPLAGLPGLGWVLRMMEYCTQMRGREDGKQGCQLVFAVFVHVPIDILVRILIREILPFPCLLGPASFIVRVFIQFAVRSRWAITVDITCRWSITFQSSPPGRDRRSQQGGAWRGDRRGALILWRSALTQPGPRRKHTAYQDLPAPAETWRARRLVKANGSRSSTGTSTRCMFPWLFMACLTRSHGEGKGAFLDTLISQTRDEFLNLPRAFSAAI